MADNAARADLFTLWKRMRFAGFMLLAACVRDPVASPDPRCPTGHVEEVDRTRVARNGRRVRAAFTATRSPESIDIDVRVQLVPTRDIDSSELDSRWRRWEAAAELAWSRRIALRAAGFPQLPVRIELTRTSRAPHHRVSVLPGSGEETHANKWYLDNSDAAVTHEVGHMLGAWDTYAHGALNPADPTVHRDGVMGDHDRFPVPAARSFGSIGEWFGRCTGLTVDVVALTTPTPPPGH